MAYPLHPWKPRASSIGSYIVCPERAYRDRMVYEGKMAKPPPQSNTSNADLGVCEHFVAQDGMRCQFGKRAFPADFDMDSVLNVPPEEFDNAFPEYQKQIYDASEHFEGDVDSARHALEIGDPRAFQFLAKEFDSASTLFGGNRDLTLQQIRMAATVVANKMPPEPNGGVWIAEEEWSLPFLTGHTDFRSQCGTIVGDLKTTAKPVKHAKYEHLAQLAGYHLFTGCQKAFILYVDSLRARWAKLFWIDYTLPGVQYFVEMVKRFAQYIMAEPFLHNHSLNPGEHCYGTWCRHKPLCHDLLVPTEQSSFDIVAARRPTGPISLHRKTPLVLR